MALVRRLGPDLDDEDLLMKRAIQEKVKQFSRELHRVNKHRATKAPPGPFDPFLGHVCQGRSRR